MDARSLRVVICSDALVGRNGVGTYYADLAAQLRPRVERIELFAPQLDPPTDHQGVSLAIPGDRTQRLFFPRRGAIGRAFRELRPHVVVIPTSGPYGLSAMRHARRLGLAICAADHTNFHKLAEIYWNRWQAGLCKWVLESSQRMVLNAAHVSVTTDSQAAAEQTGGEAELVGTPIALDFLQSTTPLPGELRRLLFVGRLAPEKNLPEILRAAAELPEFEFSIAGDGPDRRLVESHARRLSNLRYLGWLSRAEVLAAMDYCDMLLMPSHVESFGTVALEALARQRLALVSSSCGIAGWSQLEPLLFTIGRDESLANAIRRVADLPAEQRRQQAHRGQCAAQAMNQQTIDQWLELLWRISPLPSEPSQAELPARPRPSVLSHDSVPNAVSSASVLDP